MPPGSVAQLAQRENPRLIVVGTGMSYLSLPAAACHANTRPLRPEWTPLAGLATMAALETFQAPANRRVRLRQPSSTGMPAPGLLVRRRFRWVHARMCSEY